LTKTLSRSLTISSISFHTSMPYTGGVRPMNDEQKGMVWWPKT
jgi:hypothetical protein